MMSLTKTNLAGTVKKQYFFKLKSNIDSFSSLIGIQLVAILFSFGGVASSGMSGNGVNIDVKYYSSDIVIVFTLIWVFVTAITITTRPYRNHDFTFVTNRLSSSISNILFLLTASIIGGVTAMLAGNLQKVLSYILFDLESYGSRAGVNEFIFGMCATILYLFLISSIGYFIGTLVQVSKLFSLIIPVMIIGSLFLEAAMNKEPFLINIFQSYVMESAFLLFIVKAIITTAVFFVASISILNRLEVRR